jgi:glycosyltransferase involved in cell wall biosynthesis
MNKLPVTVTIITLNEEKNLPRAIKSTGWADEILVVDSGSTDNTVETAKALGARVIHNPWPGYGKQKNFAQSQAGNDWVLNIDADEEISEPLARQISEALSAVASGKSPARGFFFPRKTFYLGRWIRHGGWYPNHLVRLANRKDARWTEPSVHEELKVNGEVRGLEEPILHYTFSSIQDQILTNLQFSKLGFIELKKKGQRRSLVRLMLKPIGKFIETYFLKKGFMDGLPGFIISVNASHSMFLKYAYLIEAELENAHPDHR